MCATSRAAWPPSVSVWTVIRRRRLRERGLRGSRSRKERFMSDRREAVAEDLRSLAGDLKSLLESATTDPKSRRRKELEWRALYRRGPRLPPPPGRPPPPPRGGGPPPRAPPPAPPPPPGPLLAPRASRPRS